MSTTGFPLNRIAKLREEKNLSQHELAKLAGMHWLTLFQLETGKSKLTNKRISQLASAMNLSASYLVTETTIETCDDKTAHGRLKIARVAAGYVAASTAIRKFGWKSIAYRQHENGNRKISLAEAKAYAEAFEADPAWIAFGTGTHPDEKNDIYPTSGDVFLLKLASSKTVGSRIAAYRRYLNFTQLELANKLHISQSTLSKWESELSPPADLLPQIADLLKVNVLDLLGLGSNPESSMTARLGPAHTEAFQLLHGGIANIIGSGTAEREQARNAIIILAERLKLEAA